MEQNKAQTYLLRTIGEIQFVSIVKMCPVRDYLLVEIKRPKRNHCAVRYNI